MTDSEKDLEEPSASRSAFGDTDRAFGWRARAELAERSRPSGSEQAPKDPSAGRWDHRWRALVLVLGVVLAGLALVAGLRSLVPKPDIVELDLQGRLALLPFRNATGDHAYDWVESGLTPMVAATLGRTSGVAVLAPDRLRRELAVRGLDVGNVGLRDRLRQIALAAGADLVVEVELQRASAGDLGFVEGVAGLAGGASSSGWTAAFRIGGRSGQVAVAEISGSDPISVSNRLIFSLVRGFKSSGEPLSIEKVYSLDRFFDRLFAMGLFALETGGPEEARPFFEIALANQPYFLQAGLALAECERGLGHYERGRELAYGALEEAEARSDRPLRVAALRTLGLLAALEGNGDTAAEHYSQALGSLELPESGAMIAEVLFEKARLALADGDLEVAREIFEEILQIQRTLGDRLGELDILLQLSSLHVTQKNLDEADHLLAQALILSRELDDRWTEVRALASLGQVAQRRGDLEPALEYWTDALAYYEQRDDRSQQMWLNRRMADALISLARLQEAEDRLHRVVAMAAELDNRSAEAAASLRLAWILLRSGYPFQAKPHLDRTLELDRWLIEDRTYLQRVIAWYSYEQGNYRLAWSTQEELKKQNPAVWRDLDEEFLQVYRRALAAGERFPVPGEREYRSAAQAF